MLRNWKFAALIFLTLVVCDSAYGQLPIQIYYEERIPYAMTDAQGTVQGLTASPVAGALQAANISFEWKRMPFKRQLITIKANKKKVCGIGWFKKPERELFARFSDVIYQDRPTIILTRKENHSLDRHDTIAGLFNDESAKLLVKDDFSYGGYLDQLMEQEQPAKLVVVGSSNLEMLQIILSGRADYIFVAEEEAEEMIKTAGFDTSQFDFVRLGEMPVGNDRYLACSKKVSPGVIDQFNQALRSVK